ncbi:MAG: hypothetical protein ACRECT_01865 [Thermoplasmata archaeon]
MAEPRPSAVLPILLAVLVVAAGVAGAAYLYYEVNHRSPTPTGLLVQTGDNVTVNYVGLFAFGPQQGRVFDTSEYSVALNNASWPKSLQYSSRGPLPSDYSPLGVHVGPSAPSGGYSVNNVTFGAVVTGFWQGLLGLPVNQSHYITIPPALGYSFVNASCFQTAPLANPYPVLITLTPAQFQSVFLTVSLAAGTSFTDPVYGWTNVILSVNASAVVYENLPTLGWTSSPDGWPVVVTNISSSVITLTSQLTPGMAGTVGGSVAGSGVCGSTSFYVSQVNLAGGTYVRDFNPQVNGQTLIFAVTVVQIYPA